MSALLLPIFLAPKAILPSVDFNVTDVNAVSFVLEAIFPPVNVLVAFNLTVSKVVEEIFPTVTFALPVKLTFLIH